MARIKAHSALRAAQRDDPARLEAVFVQLEELARSVAVLALGLQAVKWLSAQEPQAADLVRQAVNLEAQPEVRLAPARLVGGTLDELLPGAAAEQHVPAALQQSAAEQDEQQRAAARRVLAVLRQREAGMGWHVPEVSPRLAAVPRAPVVLRQREAARHVQAIVWQLAGARQGALASAEVVAAKLPGVLQERAREAYVAQHQALAEAQPLGRTDHRDGW